jgi:hypothetical protein
LAKEKKSFYNTDTRSRKDHFFNGSPFNGLEKMTEFVTGHHNNENLKKNGFVNTTTVQSGKKIYGINMPARALRLSVEKHLADLV